jgi:PTS system mannitol-specific IIC component
MKAQSKGQPSAYAIGETGKKIDLRTLTSIVFACDAGMGSSAMGATVLQKKLEAAGFDNIKVKHASVSAVPSDAEMVVCHKDLAERARKSAPNAKLVTITNFMTAPEYDQIVQDLLDARINTNPEVATGTDYHGGILLKKNIILNHPAKTKKDAIIAMGSLLEESGYVTPRYTEAMFEKEKVFNTAIGNSIAIPHGIESMTGEIKNSGLGIFTFPNGLDWDDGKIVKLVIGVASVGDDHMNALAKIAEACETEEAVDRIVAMSQEEIYNLFK